MPPSALVLGAADEAGAKRVPATECGLCAGGAGATDGSACGAATSLGGGGHGVSSALGKGCHVAPAAVVSSLEDAGARVRLTPKRAMGQGPALSGPPSGAMGSSMTPADWLGMSALLAAPVTQCSRRASSS